MSISLDYLNFSVFLNADIFTLFMRLGRVDKCDPYNRIALSVIANIYDMMKDQNERARFFSGCEELGLRSWKLELAYDYCHKNYGRLVRSVLEKNTEMIRSLERKEKERIRVELL